MTGLVDRPAGDAQSFDHLAGWYDRFAALTCSEAHVWLSFRLPVRAGRAVDLGCGTGVHSTLLAARFTEVLAVDVSAPMLQRARTRHSAGNVRYEQRNLLDVTREEDGRFDTVLSTFVLHHLPDLETALEHLRSLVRPGGQLLVIDHVDERLHIPRSSMRSEAWRAFRADLLRRRRPVHDAVELLQLRLKRDWLDHRAGDRLQPPGDWDRIAGGVLPGAVISALYQARGLHWRAPSWI